jgi:hypothetical protein
MHETGKALQARIAAALARDKAEQIRDVYGRMGQSLASESNGIFEGEGWHALSQYGYRLSGPYATQAEAEAAAIAYYSTPEHFRLIAQ